MKIYYSPFEAKSNNYVNLMKGALALKQHELLDIPSRRHIFKIFKSRSTYKDSVLILNWFEDTIFSFPNLIASVIYLILVKLFFKKLIWVKHNFKPHHSKLSVYHNIITKLLNFFASEKVSHRPIVGFKYIPHPSYSYKGNKINTNERDIEFLFFGVIKRYKGILELLNNWPQDNLLHIRGFCDDTALISEINNVIIARNLSVDFINAFVEESELNLMLNRTKYVVLPHIDKSMIVSGSFYHSSSFGVNILMNDGGFYRYCKKEFCHVDLISNIGKLNYIIPTDVVNTFESVCKLDIVSREFESLLN